MTGHGSSREPAAPAAGALPPSLAAWVAAASAALDDVRGADRWDARTRREVLSALDQVGNVMTAARARVVTAEREAGTWALAGDRDLAGFLGRTSREGPAAGLAQVAQAQTLTAMPAVAKAMVDGAVTPRHVAEITRASAASPKLAAELASPECQKRLVVLAGRMDGAAFGRHLKQMSAQLDPVSRQRAHDAQRAARYLTISHTSGGTLVKALLDSVAGHKLGKAIDALCPRPGKDDDRSREMRQADALMTMVDRTVSDERTTPAATAPVQALITFTEETWTVLRAPRHGAGAGAASGSATGAGAGAPPVSGSASDVTDSQPTPGSVVDVLGRLRGVPPVVDETGQPWPASEVARALCDCTLTRVVLGAAGRPLDLGRKDRVFTRAQWLALYASGQTTCSVDGCGIRLAHTELHHMTWWQDGGRTDYANLAPVCSFHHHEIHRLGLTVTRRPDGAYELRHPDGRRYGGAPPRVAPPGVPRSAVPPLAPPSAVPPLAPPAAVPHEPGAAGTPPRTTVPPGGCDPGPERSSGLEEAVGSGPRSVPELELEPEEVALFQCT